MKLTTEKIKELVKEELESFLQEGKKYHSSKGGPIVIYYRDEDPNPDEPNDDVEKGLKDIKRLRAKGIDQSVSLDSSDPDFKEVISNLTAQGYDFKLVDGNHRVRVPGGKDYVEFVLRYNRTQRR